MGELVYTRSMLMVERHLKSFKYFIRQRESLEGSMVEGYMIYQSLVYISEYISKSVAKSMRLAFGMSTPSTNLKGRFCLRKLE